MTIEPIDIAATPEWEALARHHAEIGATHLRELFAADPDRGTTMAGQAADLYVDWSKHRADAQTMRLLVTLAERARVAELRDELFAGEHINVTEDRPVLHVALRAPRDSSLVVDGVEVIPLVHGVLDRMAVFADEVRSGRWVGASGEAIRAVVNIGIGGSDLGPAMAYEALKDDSDRTRIFRFVSNVDGDALWEATHDLDPATTLFIVASKTFTTLETLSNARSARRWLVESLGEDAVARHFVAVSTNSDAVAEFGIDTRNMFEFWDWVGGRYSVGSAIGLSLMVAIGPDNFRAFLAGMRAIDEHFVAEPLARNLPVLLGLLGVWYTGFFGTQTRAVVPYSEHLTLLPAYLQQLDMESNGTSVRRDGSPVSTPTGPVVWGTAGTNGQHAYFQLLHQGTVLVPCDFIGFAQPRHELGDHHHLLMANLLAQAEALAFGKTAEEVAAEGVAADLVPHRTFPGNRPSTVILAPKLTPSVLGQLIALAEHTVFVQGAVWGINSFDQWGVELGKELANRLAPDLISGEVDPDAHDSSTATLLRRYLALRADVSRPAT